jgi:hypothetical protein
VTSDASLLSLVIGDLAETMPGRYGSRFCICLALRLNVSATDLRPGQGILGLRISDCGFEIGGQKSEGDVRDRKSAIRDWVSVSSRYCLRISNDGHANGSSPGHTRQVSNQRRQLSPNVGFNDFLATLRTDAGGNGFDYNQLALKPKLLIDSLLLHLLTADMTLTVIISLIVFVHGFNPMRMLL